MTKLASGATVVTKETTPLQHLLGELGELARERSRFDVVVVVGHSNHTGIRLASDEFAEWDEFAGHMKLFEPRRLMLVACQASRWPAAAVLFKRLSKRRRIFASPVNTSKDLATLMIAIVPYLVEVKAPNSDLILKAQAWAIALTGRQVRHWMRRTTTTRRGFFSTSSRSTRTRSSKRSTAQFGCCSDSSHGPNPPMPTSDSRRRVQLRVDVLSSAPPALFRCDPRDPAKSASQSGARCYNSLMFARAVVATCVIVLVVSSCGQSDEQSTTDHCDAACAKTSIAGQCDDYLQSWCHWRFNGSCEHECKTLRATYSGKTLNEFDMVNECIAVEGQPECAYLSPEVEFWEIYNCERGKGC